jgi:di/tripeptidase
MENLEINDIPRQAFGDVEVKKSWTKTTKIELTDFEKQVIAAAESKPVDRVCALFMINEHELEEILKKK